MLRNLSLPQQWVVAGAAILIWATYAVPYVAYWYDPLWYTPGTVVWETEVVQRPYEIPPEYRRLLGITSDHFYDAHGYVPFWNLVDKEVHWPYVNLQAGLLAMGSLLMLVRLSPRRKVATGYELSDPSAHEHDNLSQEERYTRFTGHLTGTPRLAVVTPRRFARRRYLHGPWIG